jgi:hypothetical protein
MKLETSTELLERVRAKHGSSWYGLARLLPASVSSVANWKNGRSTIDRKFVARVAELLDESPEYVLLCLEHERESSADMRKLWQRIASKFRSHAASILLVSMGLLGVGSPTPAEAFDGHRGANDAAMYIKSNRRRKAWWAWTTWLPIPA